MIDILFVNPKEAGGFFEKMPPLGLAYMASNLEKHGFGAKIADFEVAGKDLAYWLEKYQPRFLGISGTSHTRFESFHLAQQAKDFDREITTIYGGVHATFTASETLKNIPAIDFVVKGEGEETILKLLSALKNGSDISQLPGISYRREHEIIEEPDSPRIKNLDDLSRPAYHLLEMEKYSVKMEFVNKKGISLMTSRGCLAKCSFCSASRMFNHKVTDHSARFVLDEVEFLSKIMVSRA